MKKKVTDKSSYNIVVIVQLLTLIVGVVLSIVTFWSIILPLIIIPFTFVLIFIEGRSIKNYYICTECGNDVSEHSKICIYCNSKFTK